MYIGLGGLLILILILWLLGVIVGANETGQAVRAQLSFATNWISAGGSNGFSIRGTSL